MPEKLLAIGAGFVTALIGGAASYGAMRAVVKRAVSDLRAEREERVKADQKLEERFSYDIAQMHSDCIRMRTECKVDWGGDIGRVEQKIDKLETKIDRTSDRTMNALLLMASKETRDEIIKLQAGGQ